MIGCLRTRVSTQPIIAFYFEFENVLKFYNREAGTIMPLGVEKIQTALGWLLILNQSMLSAHF